MKLKNLKMILKIKMDIQKISKSLKMQSQTTKHN